MDEKGKGNKGRVANPDHSVGTPSGLETLPAR